MTSQLTGLQIIETISTAISSENIQENLNFYQLLLEYIKGPSYIRNSKAVYEFVKILKNLSLLINDNSIRNILMSNVFISETIKYIIIILSNCCADMYSDNLRLIIADNVLSILKYIVKYEPKQSTTFCNLGIIFVIKECTEAFTISMLNNLLQLMLYILPMVNINIYISLINGTNQSNDHKQKAYYLSQHQIDSIINTWLDCLFRILQNQGLEVDTKLKVLTTIVKIIHMIPKQYFLEQNSKNIKIITEFALLFNTLSTERNLLILSTMLIMLELLLNRSEKLLINIFIREGIHNEILKSKQYIESNNINYIKSSKLVLIPRNFALLSLINTYDIKKVQSIISNIISRYFYDINQDITKIPLLNKIANELLLFCNNNTNELIDNTLNDIEILKQLYILLDKKSSSTSYKSINNSINNDNPNTNVITLYELSASNIIIALNQYLLYSKQHQRNFLHIFFKQPLLKDQNYIKIANTYQKNGSLNTFSVSPTKPKNIHAYDYLISKLINILDIQINKSSSIFKLYQCNNLSNHNSSSNKIQLLKQNFLQIRKSIKIQLYYNYQAELICQLAKKIYHINFNKIKPILDISIIIQKMKSYCFINNKKQLLEQISLLKGIHIILAKRIITVDPFCTIELFLKNVIYGENVNVIGMNILRQYHPLIFDNKITIDQANLITNMLKTYEIQIDYLFNNKKFK